MAVELVESEKAKSMVYREGYFYIKDRANKEATYWKCEEVKQGCRGRLIQKNTEFIPKGEHNHPGQPEKLESRKILKAIRQMSRTSTTAHPQAIISENVASSSSLAGAHLPSVSSMKRTIRNIRMKENNFPKLPINRESLTIPQEFKVTGKGSNFLLFDSVSDGSEGRFLIFATEENLRLLNTSQYWFADGTFKTVPNLFYQLYTIHGKVGNIVVPLVYALLPNKQKITYISLFTHLKEAMASFSNVSLFKTIITDFEIGVINAVKHSFPGANHYGCFFHFKQCLYRKITQYGLKKQYDSDVEFQQKVKLLQALSFVPVNFIEKGFNLILELNILPPEMQQFVDYFEDTWIGKQERRQRNPPLFSYTMWNCYINIIENIPVTNNIIEGWNRGFLSQVQAEKSTIWNFLDFIKREQTMAELKITKEQTGDKQPKRKYKNLNERLRNVCLEFENSFSNEDIQQYLRRIALLI